MRIFIGYNIHWKTDDSNNGSCTYVRARPSYNTSVVREKDKYMAGPRSSADGGQNGFDHCCVKTSQMALRKAILLHREGRLTEIDTPTITFCLLSCI